VKCESAGMRGESMPKHACRPPARLRVRALRCPVWVAVLASVGVVAACRRVCWPPAPARVHVGVCCAHVGVRVPATSRPAQS